MCTVLHQIGLVMLASQRSCPQCKLAINRDTLLEKAASLLFLAMHAICSLDAASGMQYNP